MPERKAHKAPRKERKTRPQTRAQTRKQTKPNRPPKKPRPQRKSSASPPSAAEPAASAEPGPAQKLHKLLAEQGLGSRREIEQWIADGRVTVDGETAHVGQRVTADVALAVDGKPLARAPADGCRVLVLNKRAGVICTRKDPEGRPTVFDGLPPLKGSRWISVGRLDVQTSGLLLLTNDGALAHRMMHPSTGLDREYAVRVNGRLDEAQIAALLDGVVVDGEELAFSDVQYFNGSGTNHWYHVVLLEGRNREVRRLFEATGLMVSRLKRVRYGPVVLPSTLRHGRVTELGEADLKTLYALLRLPLTLPKRKPARQSRKNKEKDEVPSLLLPYPDLPQLD